MAKKDDNFQQLRKRAEKFLENAKQEGILYGSEKDIQDLDELIHELQVHKVELEMQNEALRRAQNNLEASRNVLNDLYDFAPVGYATLDQNGIVKQANLTLAQMLETERSKLLNRDFHENVSYFDRDKLYLHLKEVFNSGTTKRTELWITSQKGREICVLLHSKKTEDKKKYPQCRVAISDISRQKSTKEDLNAAKNTNAAHNTLFSNISHNLIIALQDLYKLSSTLNEKFYSLENLQKNPIMMRSPKRAKMPMISFIIFWFGL